MDAKRIAQLRRERRATDSHQICHAFGHGEMNDEGVEELVGEDVVCRGFYETEYEKRGTGQMLRIAERINCVEFVDPPETPHGFEGR